MGAGNKLLSVSYQERKQPPFYWIRTPKSVMLVLIPNPWETTAKRLFELLKTLLR